MGTVNMRLQVNIFDFVFEYFIWNLVIVVDVANNRSG
jgi:hypothetical protein